MSIEQNDDPLVPKFGNRFDAAGHYIPVYDCDLRDLRDGKEGEDGFSGRPALALQLLNEDVIGWMSSLAPRSVHTVKWSLNELWRSLDAYDAGSNRERIDDVRSLIQAPWSSFRTYLSTDERVSVAARVYYWSGIAVQTTIERMDLDHELPMNPFWAQRKVAVRRTEESPYDAETVAKLCETFAGHRQGAIARIGRANRLADAGDDPRETLARSQKADAAEFDRIWTVENSARFIRDHAMLDFPPTKKFEATYGQRVLRRLRELFPPENDFPGSAGVGCLYALFLPIFADFTTWPREIVLRAGINEQAAYDFDRNDWYEQIGPNRVSMHTRKIRAKGKVVEFGSDMGPDAPWGIVMSAIRLSQPHHDRVSRALERLEALPSKDVTEKISRRVQELKALQNRVWLALDLRAFDVGALTSETLDLFRTNDLLRARGLMEGEKHLKWSGRRARDAFAYNLWIDSDCFLPAVMEGLHHDRSGQSADYMEHPLSREHDAAALLNIWETMRNDLYHVAEYGRRPGPDPAEIVAPTFQSITLFGPAHEWLQSNAPDDVLRLLGDHPEPKGSL